jgi:galactokinase
MTLYRIQDIENGRIDPILAALYSPEELPEQRKRYRDVAQRFLTRFSEKEFYLYSSPGRTELGGNHTDHNNGRVLAGSVRLDIIAAVAPRADKTVEIETGGFPEEIRADLSVLEGPSSKEGLTSELVRGIAAYFRDRGYSFGGFSACFESRVPIGSGLSSSASVEVLIGKIFSTLYNRDTVPAKEIAKAGQFSENNFFHKPCGLMDQLACTMGGILFIDFKDPGEPVIERLSFDFRRYGYRLMILDTGDSHADLTPEYAAVPTEMGCIARELGKTVLRDVEKPRILRRIPQLREKCGDRAVLRALHFYRENFRVTQMREALHFRDISSYLRRVEESALSSWTLLQNCIPSGAVHDQTLALGIAFLKELCPGGYFRVHGGGFAGTIQGYVPEAQFERLRRELLDQSIAGGDSPWRITPLSIRPEGVIQLGEESNHEDQPTAT